jgi:hypothetical protein
MNADIITGAAARSEEAIRIAASEHPLLKKALSIPKTHHRNHIRPESPMPIKALSKPEYLETSSQNPPKRKKHNHSLQTFRKNHFSINH